MSIRILLDERGIADALRRIAGDIAAAVPASARIALIGIRSRGDLLARRLVPLLATEARTAGESRDGDPLLGTLDITLYRDDLAEIGPSAVVRTTDVPFDVAGTLVFLIDDVIFTGRSIRAALDAVIDLGRPQAIRLAVLVDRGGRELPIQPDIVGVRAPDPREHVRVLLTESDGVDRVEVAP